MTSVPLAAGATAFLVALGAGGVYGANAQRSTVRSKTTSKPQGTQVAAARVLAGAGPAIQALAAGVARAAKKGLLRDRGGRAAPALPEPESEPAQEATKPTPKPRPGYVATPEQLHRIKTKSAQNLLSNLRHRVTNLQADLQKPSRERLHSDSHANLEKYQARIKELEAAGVTVPEPAP